MGINTLNKTGMAYTEGETIEVIKRYILCT